VKGRVRRLFLESACIARGVASYVCAAAFELMLVPRWSGCAFLKGEADSRIPSLREEFEGVRSKVSPPRVSRGGHPRRHATRITVFRDTNFPGWWCVLQDMFVY